MTRFAEWCTEIAVGCSAPHSHTMLTADASKFDASVAIVADVIPDHFLSPSRLAEMFARLQRHEVAKLIQNRLPESAQLKSGDLGELGRVRYSFSQTAIGLTVATSNGAADQISFEYTGPNDLIQS